MKAEAARKVIFGVCCVCFLGCCIYLGIWFINGRMVESRNQELAERFHAGEYAVGNQRDSALRQNEEAADARRKMDELSRENGDVVAWLYIEGTGIDYPVVRHTDNEYYLSRNFWKEDDRYGAIFMDCANIRGFASPHTVLYGHNMKDGAMFGALPQYLDADYLSGNSVITVTLPDGTVLNYRVFAAKRVGADDPAYRLDFAGEDDFNAFAEGLGVPGASALLTLSTCTNGSDRSERVLVHAVYSGPGEREGRDKMG